MILECLRDRLADCQYSGFRNRNWAQTGTFELLSQHGLAYVAWMHRLKGLVPPLAHATDFAYARFHGNAENGISTIKVLSVTIIITKKNWPVVPALSIGRSHRCCLCYV